jgi:hypothetical protein
MALSERLLERGHPRGPRAGGCRLGLLVTAPRIVMQRPQQMFALAAELACLAPTAQAHNVYLVPEAGPAGALDEVAVG